MKQRSLFISIPEPCHEDWSEMTPREKGRHCASCNKTVIDFTKMSKAGVVSQISNNLGDVCGRFNQDQLNVNLLPAPRNRISMKWAAVFIGLVPFSGYSQAPLHKTELLDRAIKGKRVIRTENNKLTEPISELGTLNGKLIDAETKEPILFGNVAILKGGIVQTGTETDMDGSFSIDITDMDEIEFSYIGYRPIKKSIANLKKNQKSSLIFEIEMQGYLLGDVEVVAYKAGIIKGGMTTTGGYSLVGETCTLESESWLKRQWNKFKKLITTSHAAAVEHRKISRDNLNYSEYESQEVESLQLTSEINNTTKQYSKVFHIYPNPSVGLITIKTPKRLINGLLQITNTGNQLIFSSSIYETEFQYDASNLLSGSYIISIISENELVASEVFVKI